MLGIVYDVQTYALYDGPGIRTCVHLKGCPMRCWWCQNPEGQRRAPERSKDDEEIGASVTVRDLVEQVVADKPFFERSGGGVTLTGGEPTLQFEFLLAVLDALRAEGIHTAIETCGWLSAERARTLCDHVDLFLYDLKHIDPWRHEEGTGVDNRRVLSNFVALVGAVGPERVTPRLPLVPGFNTDDDALRGIASFLTDDASYGGEVHLMPGHNWAREKYERLNRGRGFRRMPDLDRRDRERIGATFAAAGLTPVWGG